MNRDDNNVFRLPDLVHPVGDRPDYSSGKGGQQINSGGIGLCRPSPGNAARYQGKRKYDQPPMSGNFQDCRRACLLEIAICARGFEAQLLKSGQGIEQSRPTPIENVVIGQHAAVKGGSSQATSVFRTHPIVDALRIISVAARNAGFEIDDACVRLHAAPFFHGRTPNISEIQGPENRAVRSLCQPQISDSGFHRFFVQAGRARVGQRLCA